MNRLADCLGVQKSDRNYLGRWQADASDNYLASSMAIVFRIQEDCCARLREDLTIYDETEGRHRLLKFLTDQGVADEAARLAVDALAVDDNWAIPAALLDVEDSPKSSSESEASSAAEATPEPLKYFLTFTGHRRQFIRAHRSGVHLVPSKDVVHYQYVSEVKTADVHAFCKVCWKADAGEIEKEKALDMADDVSIATDEELPSCDDEDLRS